jgi:hypothetical protein
MFEIPKGSEIRRVPFPEHPNRCQQVTSQGQCLNMAVENGTKCIAHGGHKELESQRNQSLRLFRLGQWQARSEELLAHPNIKTLREEIGILRILLEERFARCQSGTDLVFQAGPISDLILKIEKVVSSCHRLEASMGKHIEKSQLLIFAGQIVNIIAEVLADDQEKLDEISLRIIRLVGEHE